MSQVLPTDFPIDPTTTDGVELADILNRFAGAVASNNSGATAPASTQAGMFWLDTSAGDNGVLRMRNGENAAWVSAFDSIAAAGSSAATLAAIGAVAKAGDTMTGALLIKTGTGIDAQLTLDKPATGRVSAIWGLLNGVNRWGLLLGDSTAGSDFVLNSYSDAGTLVGPALSIVRSTRAVTMPGALAVGGNVSGAKLTATSDGLDITGSTTLRGSVTLTNNGITWPAGTGSWGLLSTGTGVPGTAARTGNIINANSIGDNFYITTNLNPGVNGWWQFVVGAGAFQMYNTGQGVSALGWQATSDRRMKENITPVADALAKLRTLTGCTYERIDVEQKRRMAGYIAQDVQAVLPEAVTVLPDEAGTLAVDHNGVIGLLINAVRELADHVDALGAR